MDNSTYKKIEILESWIRVYNESIVTTLNNSERNVNLEAEVDFKVRVILSALMGVNMVGNRLYGIESIAGTENPTINFIRNCSIEDLEYELKSSSDESGLKRNISILNADKIMNLYSMMKENNELNTKKEDYNKNVDTEDLNREKYYGYNKMNSNTAFSNIANTQNLNRNEDLIEMCGNSIDCYINGIRVTITPQQDGTYSMNQNELYTQSMEITFNYGKDKQVVNNITLTKDEFRSFLEEYKGDIFGLEKENEISYVQESYLDDERAYTPY